MRNIWSPLTVASLLILAIGCEAPELPPSSSSASATSANSPGQQSPDDPNTSGAPSPRPEPREFTADSPEKGRRSKAAGGYLGAIGHARFWAEHEIIRLNIQKAVDLFNASEGRYPQSHEEFMQKIIQQNNIQLPQLPAGEQYIYDPSDHLLKVELSEGS